ncbi:hypothetical protein I4U23_016332 [Adineta vaga]|nr:hypothetical protein I4U23_016332 [Adineta vaga]
MNFFKKEIENKVTQEINNVGKSNSATNTQNKGEGLINQIENTFETAENNSTNASGGLIGDIEKAAINDFV